MKKLLLIDGHSILSRAFFGIPRLSTGDGRPTNAVYGFMNIVLKAIDDEKADSLAVAFDLDRKKLKRTQMYPEYKGTRKPMPEELHMQIPYAQELLKRMNVPIITLEGYEADDILGTLAKKNAAQGMEVTVLSGDRDLLQLCDEHIKVSIPKTTKGHTEVFNYYPEDVVNEYHVTPLEFIDLKALQGDTSDNIPGLPGVGEKTARDIIEKFHSIENAYEHASEVKPPRAQKALLESFDLAVLSKKLATIDINVPLDEEITLGDTSLIYTGEALNYLRELELKTLAARFSKKIDTVGGAIGTAGNNAAGEKASGEKASGDRTTGEMASVGKAFGGKAAGGNASADMISGNIVSGDIAVNVPEIKVVTVRGEALSILNATKTAGISYFESEESVVPEQMSLFDTNVAGPSFAALAIYDGKGLYVLKYSPSELRDDVTAWVKKAESVSLIDVKRTLKKLDVLRDADFFDASVAAYLINPVRGSYDYDDIAKDHLGVMLENRKELLPKGEAYSEKIAAYEAFTALAAMPVLKEKLKDLGEDKLYEEVELPLIISLNDMENAGIRVDREALKEFSGYLDGKISELEDRIYEAAGEKFNINSPAQLGNILFEKLGLRSTKKSKTGSYSTAADVLEKLAPDYPIVRDILEYRTYKKLSSTYAEGLKPYISADGRIHGTFNQTVTATGRISSTDPNLQNIPVRTDEGRKIRDMFIPAEGCILMDADYSQVELRILAALSGDEKLIDAYENSVDIHSLTASEVFHVDIDAVTPEMRRNAKAVNFGIVYGISAFGLGEDLSIDRKEAAEYIERYFETYPGVKKYLDETVSFAKENGYVKTLFGRIRPIPELKASQYMVRQFGERVAMNSPIQGTAADIMKIAMNNVAKGLEGMKSRIVLQVHDELLVEVVPEEKDIVRDIIKKGMESAAKLAVSLKVDVNEGATWNECH